jgi:hypothetical protein
MPRSFGKRSDPNCDHRFKIGAVVGAKDSPDVAVSVVDCAYGQEQNSSEADEAEKICWEKTKTGDQDG